MGCDIHSRAEIRINGEWQMLPPIFPSTYSFRDVLPDREYLETLRDDELMDVVDHHISVRAKKESGYEEIMPEIGPVLAQKICNFEQFIATRVAWGRNNRDAIYGQGDDYDHDAWYRWVRQEKMDYATQYPLSDEERNAIAEAILNYRYYTPEEWEKSWYKRFDGYDTSRENRLTVTEHRTDEDEIDWYTLSPLDSRHYGLFAQLAGVRNYNEIEPISEPKGKAQFAKIETGGETEWIIASGRTCPIDACEEVRRFCTDRMGPDGHSHSWLSYQEFLDWGCHKIIEYRGWLTQDEFDKLVNQGYTYGGNIGPVSYWYEKQEDSEHHYYRADIEVCWMAEKGSGRGEELNTMLQIFKRIVAGEAVPQDGGGTFSATGIRPEDLRVCFYFDN
jgi:hypothetical protein